jgi:hypothetical protein
MPIDRSVHAAGVTNTLDIAGLDRFATSLRLTHRRQICYALTHELPSQLHADRRAL